MFVKLVNDITAILLSFVSLANVQTSRKVLFSQICIYLVWFHLLSMIPLENAQFKTSCVETSMWSRPKFVFSKLVRNWKPVTMLIWRFPFAND